MRAARRWESAMCAMVFVSLNGNLRPPSLDPWCSELVTEYFLLFSSRWDGSLSCLKSRRLRRGREEGNLNPPINYLCRPTVLTFSPASSSPKKKSYFQTWKSNRSKSDHFSFGIYGEWILFFIIILDCLWLLRMVDNRSRPIVKGKWFSFPFVRVKRILNIDNFVKNIYEINNAPLCSFVTFYFWWHRVMNICLFYFWTIPFFFSCKKDMRIRWRNISMYHEIKSNIDFLD